MSDESAPKAPPTTPVLRDSKGRLLPGAKLYTPGRPISLARYIASKTNDGEDMVDQMLEIWEGKRPEFKSRERLEAGKWLGERLWGKAIDLHAIANLDPQSDAGTEIRTMASEALMRLANSLAPQVPPSSEILQLEPERGSSVVAAKPPDQNHEPSP